MASITLNNLTKRWGDFVAVDKFDLEIQDEEFLVLLGPSGCGKTTTMRMIAGLEEITEGNISIDGKVVNHLEPKDRDIAMVFQSYGLYPHMNVYENIRFPLHVRKVDRADHDERVMRAAQMVELTDFLHRKPSELSGGQRQRVALARAIVREPNVFLMDEPLSNLDAKLRVSTRAQIKHLHHQLKVTTVYVTHDQIEAMTMADKIVVLQAGVIEQIGSPMELYDKPCNKFVAGFIGSPKMNFLEGSEADKYNAHTIGVRPEHISISKTKGQLVGTVGVVEHLGSDTYLHVSCENSNEQMIVRADANNGFKYGDKIHLTLDIKNIHRFNNHGVCIYETP